MKMQDPSATLIAIDERMLLMAKIAEMIQELSCYDGVYDKLVEMDYIALTIINRFAANLSELAEETRQDINEFGSEPVFRKMTLGIRIPGGER